MDNTNEHDKNFNSIEDDDASVKLTEELMKIDQSSLSKIYEAISYLF